MKAVFFMLVFPCSLFAQDLKINLSPKHLEKLSAIESGHRRMVKFYKFYKKDSASHFKKLEKRYKKTLDSAYREEKKRERLQRRLAKKGIAPPKQLTYAEKLDNDIKRWHDVLKDTASSDSLRQTAKVRIKELAIAKAKTYPGFQHQVEKYQLDGDVPDWKALSEQAPGLDTLQNVFNSSPQELFSQAEKMATENLRRSGDLAVFDKGSDAIQKFQDLPDEYEKKYGEYKKYADKEHLKQQGEEEAVKKALDYFADHADKLQGAQAKISKLLSKYREFSNAADLSNATRRTSMKGKAFREHLVIGGNFNILSTSPLSIDLSPQFGYKFTTNFFLGVGIGYRYTAKDSIKHNWYVSPVNTSFKVLANYDIMKGFFACSEWERSRIALKSRDLPERKWKDNYFVGLGKKFLVHPKLYLTTSLLYNLNDETKNAVHPKRLQMKIGFQLSELATRKKQIYYNPNR